MDGVAPATVSGIQYVGPCNRVRACVIGSHVESEFWTLTRYAERRGVSVMAVSRAVKKGTLKECVVRDEHGRPKISDPDLADREWAANTDYTDAPYAVAQKAADYARQAPAPSEELNFAEAGAKEKYWKAQLAELKYKQEAAELVPAAEVRSKVEGAFRTCKTRLLAIPSRARQAIPHLTVEETASLEDLIREALEELSA